jgi:methionine-S-sulfoxide reductase
MRVLFLALTAVMIGTSGCAPIGAADPKPPRASDNSAKKPASAEAKAGAAKKDEAARQTETAVFAGGCFWCTEFAFEQLAGVVNVESGYCGGSKSTANYEHVHLGTTGHAEVIRVTYDPKKITYDELLDVFFDAHDPTQLNRQGEDKGRQYRSAIFFANEEQQQAAKAKIADLEAKKVYKRKIVTKLEPLKTFYLAEDDHQDFARKNPYQPYIQGHAVPKALRVRAKHPELIRDDDESPKDRN